MLEFFISGIIIAAIGLGFVYLFTRSGSRARAWITGTPNRIEGLGIVILVVLSIGVLTYNESNRTDFTQVERVDKVCFGSNPAVRSHGLGINMDGLFLAGPTPWPKR